MSGRSPLCPLPPQERTPGVHMAHFRDFCHRYSGAPALTQAGALEGISAEGAPHRPHSMPDMPPHRAAVDLPAEDGREILYLYIRFPNVKLQSEEDAMKRLISNLGFVALVVSSSLLVYAQSNVTVTVSPRNEENYNKLISWLSENALFSGKSSFIASISETFRHAKNGNIEQYRYWLEIFKSEMAKLSDVEKTELVNFALSSFTIDDTDNTPTPMTANTCEISCGLSKCRVSCESGASAVCKCNWFFAECGCFYN